MTVHTASFAGAALVAFCIPVAAQHSPPPDAPVSPQALIDGFEGAFGTHAGFRRGGAKGVCAEGHFIGAAEGRAISSAAVFSGERFPVIARFSVGGGNPQASDKSRSMRGLALQFSLPGDERWQMANISAPVNSVSTPQNMLRFLEARKLDPDTKKPDPARIAAFNNAHPEIKAQAEWFAKHGVPASYAAVNYWGVHAFKFSNAKGQGQYVKWVFEPSGGQEVLDDDKVKQLPDHFLADGVAAPGRRPAGRVPNAPATRRARRRPGEPDRAVAGGEKDGNGGTSRDRQGRARHGRRVRPDHLQSARSAQGDRAVGRPCVEGAAGGLRRVVVETAVGEVIFLL